MKKFLSLSLLSILLCAAASAQSLSIEEAVTGQYAEFYPDRLSGLQWLENEDLYSYTENDVLYVKDARGKVIYRVSLDELRKNAGLEMDGFPGISWLADGTFRFRHDGAWYLYNPKSGSARKWMDIPSGNNHELHEATGNVAFARENNVWIQAKGTELQITDLPEGVTAGQAIARYEFGISKGLFWSEDGRKLAFYEKDERNVTEYPLVDHNGPTSTLRALRYPMAGQPSEFGACGIYDLASRSVTYLNVNEGLRDDTYYITNVAWAPDGSLTAALVNRAQNEMRLVRFDSDSGEPLDVLFVETDEKYVEPENPALFIPGSKGDFLWISERDGYDNFYRYNANGELTGRTDLEFPVSDFLGFDKKGRTAFFEAHGPSPIETHIFALDLRSMKTRMISSTGGTHSGQVSPSGRYLIDRFSNLETPGITRIISSGGKIATEIHRAEDPLAGREIGDTELLTIKADDGSDLWCRLIKPKGMDPDKKYPAVVYVYNGPHVQLVTNRWMAGAPLWMHHLAAEGFVVFTVDGRGSSNRGKEFEQAVFRQLGTLEMEDQLAGVGYLKSLPYVDPERLGVHGWSFGGFMTTSLMLRKPGVFKVGVAGGPVIDWRLYEVMYTERYMDTPEENPKGFERADLTNYIDQLDGELMLIHGDVDDIVVMQHSMKLIKAAVDAGVQLDFFVYPGHPHNVRGKDRVHLMTKVIKYLKTHLEK